MAQTILYYPEINIKNDTWLKTAILYWDEVSSIVPYKNYGDLSPELLYLQNLGIYSAVYPQELFYSKFAEDFCNAIVKRISAYERSISKASHDTQNKRVPIHKDKIYAPALHTLIHYEKLPESLLPFFKDKRFINDYNLDGWMEIDSKIAQIYMKTLAEYSIKCSDKDIVLGTDTATHSREIYSGAYNRSDLQTQCCKINIQNCLPQPSTDVSYEDILNFKDRRKDELYAFRAKIRELETNIYNADSPELIKHYESQFIESWKRCSNDFYSVLKDAKIPFFLSSIACIVATPFVGQLLSPHFGPSLTATLQSGAQLLSVGAGYYNYKNKISPAKADGGFSYIIKASKDGIVQL